jgi:hypothetical protein
MEAELISILKKHGLTYYKLHGDSLDVVYQLFKNDKIDYNAKYDISIYQMIVNEV